MPREKYVRHAGLTGLPGLGHAPTSWRKREGGADESDAIKIHLRFVNKLNVFGGRAPRGRGTFGGLKKHHLRFFFGIYDFFSGASRPPWRKTQDEGSVRSFGRTQVCPFFRFWGQSWSLGRDTPTPFCEVRGLGGPFRTFVPCRLYMKLRNAPRSVCSSLRTPDNAHFLGFPDPPKLPPMVHSAGAVCSAWGASARWQGIPPQLEGCENVFIYDS